MAAGSYEGLRMMAGVLIVAEQRELRRRVFDALDQAGDA